MFSGEAQPSTTNRQRGELKKSESRISKRKQQVTKPLNIGLIGCGFMGRAHSNAYRKVNNFFDRKLSKYFGKPVQVSNVRLDQMKA